MRKLHRLSLRMSRTGDEESERHFEEMAKDVAKVLGELVGVREDRVFEMLWRDEEGEGVDVKGEGIAIKKEEDGDL